MGERPRSVSGVVAREDFLVLAVVGLRLRDGGHAEGEDIGAAAGAVALEVALEGAGGLGESEPVAGAGEVVHADAGPVAGGEGLDGGLEDLKLLLGRGERGLDDLLARANPGNVGVVEDCELVGREGERAEEGVGERGGRLVEAVDEVEVEGLAGLAQPVDGLADERLGLDAVDGLPDARIEILDAERGAVSPELAGRRRRGRG